MANKASKMKEKVRDLETIIDGFKNQGSEVKMDDFRDVVVKIPGNINAEVPEDKNGFLFDSNTGKVYALNRTASFIFCKMKEEMPLSEIASELTSRYDVNEGIAVSDIQDFLYQIRELGISST